MGWPDSGQLVGKPDCDLKAVGMIVWQGGNRSDCASHRTSLRGWSGEATDRSKPSDNGPTSSARSKQLTMCSPFQYPFRKFWKLQRDHTAERLLREVRLETSSSINAWDGPGVAFAFGTIGPSGLRSEDLRQGASPLCTNTFGYWQAAHRVCAFWSTWLKCP
jgi:hypothetical protein